MSLLTAMKLLRDSNKNLEHYPINHIFVSIPSVGVEHFWVDGKHIVAYS